MRTISSVAAVIVAFGPGLGLAASDRAPERCTGRAAAHSRSVEGPGRMLRRGRSLGPITEVRVDRRSGRMTYCGRNHCYPSEGIRLSTCVIPSVPEASMGGGGEAEVWVYWVR